ncbi:MAG: hypothetical protein A3C79_00560 [Candidatus Taylorbacteria bacterium RIFCSPHIGHO2_02_FULL_45_28]|uniref:Uncharacterized protein n=1 Tax=Candidatus Taylorbacteria bacterium RIFCSPHIGHO2_12_FULL_45_16 TaxID=1802315 RepID=A0A1G2N192_9BACT|nr:MAG: hypothetical protein A2830_01815 [Candidatus Taylorbacteria bacterium RIFCSPHIGHO2_01_FULL_44_110]OHA25512.1 MAG: hypothetical protein A3C79_00560 [Candidatus Taylorbacteria bacterium RIFCSPHIGHO2_02_FULL_45_28]OHA29179.1 MAG: hypothetical protein A3F51_01025 [Candidatus Taylorbacteria bacterium RIFCSPHIGHO2_12_FULL_45_16]OHA33401.1 MAG: hypothetical protein A3A23_01905 [Candidatus Taylorbacteria bacterium RIFCSPLOWO2_01_FULL_45_59]OHA39487.1 MAG: hypothetical protein A3I98_03875 [Candi
MDFRDIHKSQKVRGILIGLGVVVLVLVIFQTGQVLGYHKAKFGARFGDNFEKNFVGPRGGNFVGRLPSPGMPGGHGAVGEIVSIALPQVVVAGPDNLEKTVLVGTSTRVREFQDEINVGQLKVGDFVVVLGNPNEEGQVDAKLIRLMPPPPDRVMNNQPMR